VNLLFLQPKITKDDKQEVFDKIRTYLHIVNVRLSFQFKELWLARNTIS